MSSEGGLFKKGIFIVVLKATGILASYAFTLMVTNLFGAKAYGQYSLFFAIINIGAIIALFGTERSVIKLYNDKSDIEGKQNVLHSFLTICISSAVFSIVLYFGWDLISSQLFKDKQGISEIKPYVFVLLFYGIFIFISESIRAKGNMKLYGLLRFNAIFTLGIIILYFLWRLELEWAPVKSFAIAVVSAATIGLVLFFAEYGRGIELQSSRLRRIFNLSYPMLLASSMGLIIGWVDTFMLGYFEDEAAVGIYNVAYKVAFVSSILLSTLTTVISPKVARLSSEAKNKELKKLIDGVAKILFFGAGFIFLISILNMELILGIFGEEFVAGKIALAVLLIGQFVSSYSGPVAMLLQMTGNEKIFMYISISVMILNVLLNLLLIPAMGFEGAAIASAVTLIINNLACVYFVKKRLGFTTFFIPYKSRA